MGCCESAPEEGRASVEGRATYNNSRLRGVCVIEVIKANHLPNMDIGSLTDAYVTVRCMDSDNPLLMNVKAERTLTRNNSLDPVFHVYMAFPFIPHDSDNIFLDVKDEDSVGSDDNIGTCKITFAELKTRKNVTMDLKMNTSKHSRDGKNPSLSFRLVRHGGLPTSPVKKEIFIVRHGQSKWNVAKSETHVAHMLQQYDHELTTVGIQQAEQFNARWKELKRQKDAGEAGVKREDMDDLEKFLSATAIFASPLTRATQTALLTCEDHPSTLGSGGITLLSNLREVKSGPGSFDTVGSHSGQGIATHVSAMLTRDMGAQRAKKVMVPLAHNDAVDEWWTPISAKDHKEDVSARFRELWSFLRYGCSDEVIVLVGHSSFFLRLMRDHMCPDFKTNNPEWADALATRKLDNGAGLRLSVEWSPHAGPMQHPQITNARLIFDTQLKKEKHKGAHSLPHEASVGSVELDMQ